MSKYLIFIFIIIVSSLESCSDKNTELNTNENNIQSKKETISKKIIHLKNVIRQYPPEYLSFKLRDTS